MIWLIPSYRTLNADEPVKLVIRHCPAITQRDEIWVVYQFPFHLLRFARFQGQHYYTSVCVWIIRHHDECATTKGNQAGAARLMGSSVTGIYLHKSTCNTQVRPFVIDRGGKKLRGRRKETGEREITSQTSHQVHWILIYKAIISACFV